MPAYVRIRGTVHLIVQLRVVRENTSVVRAIEQQNFPSTLCSKWPEGLFR